MLALALPRRAKVLEAGTGDDRKEKNGSAKAEGALTPRQMTNR